MTIRKRNWLLVAGLAGGFTAGGLTVAAFVLSGRIEPYARDQAVRYLSQRFDSDVQLQTFHLHVPKVSPVHLLLTRHWGASARIEGEGLSLRKKESVSAAPLFVIRKFEADLDMDSLFRSPIQVSHISVEGMEIKIPPHDPQGPIKAGTSPTSSQGPAVMIEAVDIQQAGIVLLPRDPQKIPLRLEIQNLQLRSKGPGAGMLYDASLVNAKPPGLIHATGTFGPWHSAEPGETPIAGDYSFENADLGVFNGIAGTLTSHGSFEGQLSAFTVRGKASVPNFRLRRIGNPVPLQARFEALVDATNGNTTLHPVMATLGGTNFTASGGIIKREADQPRAISLDVSMTNGNLHDVLLLAMKQPPALEGRLALQAKVDIPPLAGKVEEKLIVDGHFQVLQGHFHQSQLNSLLQRTLGQHGDADPDPAIVRMTGAFHLENALIHFRELSFAIPWANLDMAGDYNLESDAVDLDGRVKVQPAISDLVTGWKRLVLRPVDKFLGKKAAGALLHIRVTGTSKSPQVDLNFGRK